MGTYRMLYSRNSYTSVTHLSHTVPDERDSTAVRERRTVPGRLYQSRIPWRALYARSAAACGLLSVPVPLLLNMVITAVRLALRYDSGYAYDKLYRYLSN